MLLPSLMQSGWIRPPLEHHVVALVQPTYDLPRCLLHVEGFGIWYVEHMHTRIRYWSQLVSIMHAFNKHIAQNLSEFSRAGIFIKKARDCKVAKEIARPCHGYYWCKISPKYLLGACLGLHNSGSTQKECYGITYMVSINLSKRWMSP